MKAFVTFILTLFNSHAASAGRRASQQAFSSRVHCQGLVRMLIVLLAAVLLGTGLSALQARNSQPQPVVLTEGRTSEQASGHASDGAFGQVADGIGTVAVADLPAEARRTLVLIREGGPYPYEKDGSVFGNYERKLPRQRRGYYTEYTVKTPRVRSRGARRIIAGGRDGRPTEFYYTDDHYQTFRRIEFP